MRTLGLKLTEVTGTRATGTIEFGSDHHTPWGVVHGGAYASVVEQIASAGASKAVEGDGMFAVGAHNSTDFFRPTTVGTLTVLAVPIYQGRSQQLWLVTLTREDGAEVARGQLRLANVPLPGRS
jgi:1,4-dihydroxy-2-naphthoyl-CoA hydrolase